MVIYFRTRKLQKVCSNRKAMQKQYSASSGKLQQRLMELQAVGSLKEISHLPPPRCHALSGDRTGQFSVDLEHPYRLLFIPANDPVPRLEDGGIDRSKVSEIEIVEIADTH
ncbi:MAG: killer suppression protein [Gammaproteobacteria bacterium]|nr:killer suppression protein [Gammaproteobacteria bacterium]NNJ84506.1 killer suppression protein [Gammaproteobacteria bacterium]